MDASDDARVLLWEIIVINIDNIDIDDIDIVDIDSDDIDIDDNDIGDINIVLMLMILIWMPVMRNHCHLMSSNLHDNIVIDLSVFSINVVKSSVRVPFFNIYIIDIIWSSRAPGRQNWALSQCKGWFCWKSTRLI